MRITEKSLRNTIRQVMSEMSGMMSQMGMSPFMKKAQACCKMSAVSLFDMCAQICMENPDQKSHCAELCACVCRGDEQGCCRCLGEICKCDHCAQICADCCGC